jgi:hypothetical protein
VLASGEVAGLDAPPEGELLLGVEQGNFVDLLEVGLQTAFGRNSGAPL